MKFTFPPESRPLDGFTLKRAIYRGGFGEVYYGLSDAGREVALKLLQHNTDVELRGVQQCLNLSHPHLVTIFDVRKDADGDHWIVMEYVAGETLEAAILRHPNGMPIETVLKWLPGLAAGISYLHSCGLVHRDLKPANIFIENDVVKVGDVGLSKFISPSRQSAHTQSVGTVYYMAPEVAKGRYGKGVDIYALGVILYEMLTGELPFDGESTGEILMKHLTEQPDLSKLPPRLRDVIGKAMRKDPEQRYASVEALRVDFENAVLGRRHSPETFTASQAKTSTSSTEHFQSAQRVSTGSGQESSQQSTSHRLLTNPLFVAGALLFVLISVRGARIFILPAVSWAGLVVLGICGWILWKAVRGTHQLSSATFLAGNGATSNNIQASRPQIASTRGHHLSKIVSTSLLIVPVTGVLITLLAVLRPSLFTLPRSEQIDPGMLGLFASVSIVASWGLTVFPACFQSHRKSQSVSRWWYGMAGLLIGLVAWNLDQFLLVDFPAGGDFHARAMLHKLGDHPLITYPDGPTLAGYLAFFTTLSFFGNWRKLTATTRRKRFSFLSTFTTIFIAFLVTRLVPFPISWALVWPAVIACSLQLTSPWEDSSGTCYVQRNHRPV